MPERLKEIRIVTKVEWKQLYIGRISRSTLCVHACMRAFLNRSPVRRGL